MLPTTDRTLHVLSTNVFVDGAPRLGSVLVVDGVVAAIDPREDELPAAAQRVDVGDRFVVPAPLDLHFHGAGGHVVPPGGGVAAIDEVLAGRFDAPYEWVATLPIPATPPSDPVEELARCAGAIAELDGATGCRGIRIEGLFLNPTRAGVWPPETFRTPDTGLLGELHAAAAGHGVPLLVVDVAPELPGALELIEQMVELGIVASLAHSDATWEQATAAIDAGARLATHTWNAMRPVAHRDPGIVAAVLADERVTCELICDGVHLHPGTIALSIAASGPGRWIAVSDASPFAGCKPGEYEWAGTTITHDGTALRDPAGHLAGSGSLLDHGWHELQRLGLGGLEAALAAGADPRRVLDPTRPRGLQVGDPAWIVPAP